MFFPEYSLPERFLVVSLCRLFGDHLVNCPPVGESAEILVVNVNVGDHFTGFVGAVGEQSAFGLITVDREELQPPFLAEPYGVFK